MQTFVSDKVIETNFVFRDIADPSHAPQLHPEGDQEPARPNSTVCGNNEYIKIARFRGHAKSHRARNKYASNERDCLQSGNISTQQVPLGICDFSIVHAGFKESMPIR